MYDILLSILIRIKVSRYTVIKLITFETSCDLGTQAIQHSDLYIHVSG